MKENQIIMIVTAVLALYDFFSVPFSSFLVTCVFALVIYYLTNSMFLLAFVFFVPQVIKMTNTILGRKENMTDTPKEISERLQNISKKFSRGVNLNPETPTKEYFTDAKEVSQRNIEIRNKNILPHVKEVEGVVDTSMPSGVYPIEGDPSYPNFMKEGFMGTNINASNRIETVPEETVPAVGTVEATVRANNVIEPYDDVSVNTALAKNSSNIPISSNMKSVDMTM